jgi:hypothetical protein
MFSRIKRSNFLALPVHVSGLEPSPLRLRVELSTTTLPGSDSTLQLISSGRDLAFGKVVQLCEQVAC